MGLLSLVWSLVAWAVLVVQPLHHTLAVLDQLRSGDTSEQTRRTGARYLVFWLLTFLLWTVERDVRFPFLGGLLQDPIYQLFRMGMLLAVAIPQTGCSDAVLRKFSAPLPGSASSASATRVRDGVVRVAGGAYDTLPGFNQVLAFVPQGWHHMGNLVSGLLAMGSAAGPAMGEAAQRLVSDLRRRATPPPVKDD